MKVLAIDSSSGISGYAFLGSDGSYDWGALKKPTQARRTDLILHAKENGCDCVAIEYPFSGARANLGILLGIAYGEWRADCQREGMAIVSNSMRASDWQRHVLGKVPRGESKLWARNKAGEMTDYSFRKKDQDACDALCMLRYCEELAATGLLEVEP